VHATTETRPLRCSILRGGTSRGVFFHAADLPAERERVAPILLNVFGSPDARQINGLGGATSLTSKAAIIGPSSRQDADVDYTFAQVSVTAPTVDWGGNCGNISSAVGPFAIDAGYIAAGEGDGVRRVRIHNTNTGKLFVASVPVRDGRALVEGDYAIPGVPGTGARIDLDFTDPAGSYAGRLLPTGRPCDVAVLTDGRRVEVSLVDAANPVVFVDAACLGLTGAELPDEIAGRPDIGADLEAIRSLAASWLGIVDDPAEATRRSPGLPKVGFVAPPASYRAMGGEEVAPESIDLVGRMMSMQTPHRAYAVTGAICTAAAATINGTVVQRVARPVAGRPNPDRIRIGHPAGVMDALVRAEAGDGEPRILGVSVGRTARHILDGTVFVPAALLEGT
jgi:2-methylaconitate cis-trans-isomerase PrpF